MSKHKQISKKKRILVWEKYDHHCAYCGCQLEYKDMQVDHIKSVYQHNDLADTNERYEENYMSQDELNEVDNLMPSCRMCNFYKGASNIEAFREKLSSTLMENVRKPFDYRLALKYGLIKEDIKPIKFYFEEYSEKNSDVNPYLIGATTNIKALDQKHVLDKIRAEVEALPKTYPFVNHIDMYVKEDDVKKIIDKYKVESEGKE